MLNTFPTLLTYGFFAPTLLRVTAAGVIAYLAYSHYNNRNEIANTNLPVLGRAAWVPWVSVVLQSIFALGLFLGYYTQISAIAGAILSIKYIFWGNKKYPQFFVIPRSTAILLLVICLSLLVSGAGAFAFDLPL